MRAVVQRVQSAAVHIETEGIVGQIGRGLLILLGIAPQDEEHHRAWLLKKLLHLRIFSDSNGKMNLSLLDVQGQALVVSQFTLFANIQKGNRPSFVASAAPDYAQQQYDLFCQELRAVLGTSVATGRFGALMQVHLVNDGPVTIVIDTDDYLS
ncbi:MAG: D-aminoacyl-tRNA deacylase [Bernardetiaceae bacterium]